MPERSSTRRKTRQQKSPAEEDITSNVNNNNPSDTPSSPNSTAHSTATQQNPPTEEPINEDDICQICHLLLLRPVKTTCNHIFCEPCFSHWADVSINQMTLGLAIDEPMLLPSNEVEARCPMCRTSTVAQIDQHRTAELQSKYPTAYRIRARNAPFGTSDEDGAIIEHMTLYIGNEHRLQRRESASDRNTHEWRFFVRASRTDIIEEVQVFLHPTFRQSSLVLQYPPYSIRRVGWGVFTIHANVVLKAGYSWVSPEAEDTSDGQVRGKLPLEWMLDFGGGGSQGRLRLKVRKEKEGVDWDLEVLSEGVRRGWVRQREGDPDYVPTGEE
ncbi:hypothetical protein OHC33_010388 [Knufia fluminis]|uniref:Protein AF-9 homolog n=1 Tax=Knufia fluminis TaxID=191047 RepID=A0AAN8E860_9EURO|nr:hypothetical protein OHC33_010388 [Knufia fluminis]